MKSKPFIALYKAYRGGEWFELSLEAVSRVCDGAAVVFSDGPWKAELALPGNCTKPLERFRATHPDFPVFCRSGAFRRQEDQYNLGLETIRIHWGEDAAVLIVDTDEVWSVENLSLLRTRIATHPDRYVFRAQIKTYLRSPLYQVWPPEGLCLVGLQDARAECTEGRFRNLSGPSVDLPDAEFDHFSYVRADEADIREKFANTSSQEDDPSRPDWLETVWPVLPCGENLHMTPGSEACWSSIKILPIGAWRPRIAIDRIPWLGDILTKEDLRWRDRLRHTPYQKQLLPQPTWDHDRYDRHFPAKMTADFRRENMKTSCLEALVLADLAATVPSGGRIAEAGCGFGCSTACLALASHPAVEVDAIDPFEPYTETAAWGTTEGVTEGNEARFWATLNQCGASGVNLLKHSIADAVPVLHPDSYDLIFLDANHSYEHVRHDIAALWPHVKPGGIFVGHDYTTRFPGVIGAADEFPDADFSTFVGTSLFYARKPA